MIKEFCIGRKHKKLVDFDIYVYGCTVETCEDGKITQKEVSWEVADEMAKILPRLGYGRVFLKHDIDKKLKEQEEKVKSLEEELERVQNELERAKVTLEKGKERVDKNLCKWWK